MTRVSDLYIELIPPNPLELQVTVAGAYESLTWSHGDTELAGSGSVSFSDFRQTLTFSSTSAGDVGEYTAAVSGSESVTFQVQEFSESISGISLVYVYMSPSIDTVSPVLFTVGSMAGLNCAYCWVVQNCYIYLLPILTYITEQSLLCC